jgi:hypothetical protein
MLASIEAEAIIGTSAVTYNLHFMPFLSPFECEQSLGVFSQWPDIPVLLVLDSFHPLQCVQLLQQACLHGPGTWILHQEHKRQGVKGSRT